VLKKIDKGKGKRMGKITTLKPRIETIKTSVLVSVAVERIRGWKLTKIRKRILLRDNYTCRKCGRVSVDLEIDHVTPLHLGGQETDSNRQSLCRDCHDIKSLEEEKERR
jgi:5-methylcytosine-specific restriction protein A